MSIESVRKDYSKHILVENDCPSNPIDLLNGWLQKALEQSIDANAMVLSTVNENGAPSSRVVLVRRIEDRGLSFFTNYNSHKGREMDNNQQVALNFFWPWLERQVRVEGIVSKLSAQESDEYFASRPKESQIGAWASSQSEAINGRDELEKSLADYTEKFKNSDVPRPEHWGGYLVRPKRIEFWQGRPSRLHDRILYEFEGGAWHLKRLNP